MLLYNNRWICLLPFARKPDPRRASKQVSREPPPLAWFVPRRRPNEKRRRQANSARRRPEKLRDRSAAISLLFSLGCCSRCSHRAAPPAARCSQGGPPREGASFSCRIHVSVCGFFFLLPTRHKGCTRASHADRRPPKQQGICSGARRWPFWGGAGRRPPCPNGALLEKNGRVARREEAAGASRWGLGSENRPSRRWALNNQPQGSSI